MPNDRKTQLTLALNAVTALPAGYYSGDRENETIATFIRQHAESSNYDQATDNYSVTTFKKPIEASKNTPIYNMHTYWSKKPHDAIREYIRHFTKPGDLILDPFCGSGGTALAAIIEKRKAIAIDRSPAATFITKNYCTPTNQTILDESYSQLKESCSEEINWLYETRCHECDGAATTVATVYSQVITCSRCLARVPLFDTVEAEKATAKGKGTKSVRVCPHCYPRHIEEISTRSEKLGSIPVLSEFICHGGCEPSRMRRLHNDPDSTKRDYFQKFDVGKIEEIEKKTIPYWYPATPMIKGYETCIKRRLDTQGVNLVSDLFTKRNLWALSAYFDAAKKSDNAVLSDSFRLALNSILLAMSRMQGYTEDTRFPNQLMRGTYYLPPTGREYNVSQWLDGKLKNLTAGFKAIAAFQPIQDFVISTQSATKMGAIPAGSIDYIFTDPPYGAMQQYAELNFVWECWLGLDTSWQHEDLVVNEYHGVTESDWANMMREAMAECYRVLKPGRWLTLCYHGSEGTWAMVQDIMAEVGFLADNSDSALYIDTAQKSFNQRTGDKVNMRDLVINFRKPRVEELVPAGVITGDEDKTTFNQKLKAIIRDYIGANPGCSKDRIYDEVVSRMVRAGRMEDHNFTEVLKELAEEVRDIEPTQKTEVSGGGRWYLKEAEEAVIDTAESAREDAAAKTVLEYINKRLTEAPTLEGVHYSELVEFYIYSVPMKNKPRRRLQDWLIDYFFKTTDGTWRPAQSEEEEALKADARASGTNRRMKKFAAMLSSGGHIPPEKIPAGGTLCEWIRQAKRTGQYEIGRLLYERGGLDLNRLTEEVVVAVEEDYQTCVRATERSKTDSKPKPARKAGPGRPAKK